MRSTVQMAASFSQIKTVTAQSFRLFVLTINRMLALSVFKKTKGTGFAYNKALKITPFGRSDAFTRGGFAIMPHATAPLSLMLGVIYLQHKKVGSAVTFQHQGCFARSCSRLAFSVVSTALATRFSSTSQRQHSTSPAF